MAETAGWRARAILSWRQQALGARLRQLLDIDIDPASVQAAGEESRALVDGVTFVLRSATNQLALECTCPRCHKAQPPAAVESLGDIGRALDSLCRDCEFLVKAGLEDSSAPARR
ncbi:MAG: hypothetical protein ACRDHX_03305 [Chloroflexota bacterium]